MLDEAVSNNKTYRPSKTAEPTEVWDSNLRVTTYLTAAFISGVTIVTSDQLMIPQLFSTVFHKKDMKSNDYLWVKTEKFEGGVNHTHGFPPDSASSLTEIRISFGVV